MKTKELPEKIDGPYDAPDGRYWIHHQSIADYYYHVLVSTGLGWEHLSVTIHKVKKGQGKTVKKPVERCCTWGEMCYLKNIFWNPDECVVQYHPPMQDYVSNHEYCLHLWRPTEVELPKPEAIMVGLTTLEPLVAEISKRHPTITKQRIMEAIFYCDGDKLKFVTLPNMSEVEEDREEELEKWLTDKRTKFFLCRPSEEA